AFAKFLQLTVDRRSRIVRFRLKEPRAFAGIRAQLSRRLPRLDCSGLLDASHLTVSVALTSSGTVGFLSELVFEESGAIVRGGEVRCEVVRLRLDFIEPAALHQLRL